MCFITAIHTSTVRCDKPSACFLQFPDSLAQLFSATQQLLNRKKFSV